MNDLGVSRSTGPELGKVKCQLHKDLEHVRLQVANVFKDVMPPSFELRFGYGEQQGCW